MMKQGDLMQEVEAVIEARLGNNEAAPMTWIVQRVMLDRDRISGDDKDFYVLCGYEHVQRTVREVLRRRLKDEGKAEPDQADLFPGFKRLQQSYTIERGEEQVVVRLEQMSVDEVRAKARELRAMAMGCMAHAQELEDFIGARNDQPAAVA